MHSRSWSCHPPDNPGPRSHSHLGHNQAEKGLNRIWANLHSLRDFLARKTLSEQFHRLAFANSKIKLLCYLGQIGDGRRIALKQDPKQWRLLSAATELECAAEVTALAGFEFFTERQ